MGNKLTKWIAVVTYTALIYLTLPYLPKLWFLAKSKTGSFLTYGVNFSCLLFILVWSLFLIKQIKRIHFSFNHKILLFSTSTLYIFLFVNLKLLIERIHLIEYGFLSYLVWLALEDKKIKLKKFSLAIIITFLIGLGDELLQRITPGRVYDLRDIATNWLSSFIGLVWAAIIKR